MVRRSSRPACGVVCLAAVVLLAACEPEQAPRFTAPWADGEVSHYDVLGAGGKVTGTATFTLTRTAEGWRLDHEQRTLGRTSGAVEMDAGLWPLRAWSGAGQQRVETTYSPTSITTQVSGGKAAAKTVTVARPPAPVDNDQVLVVQRALPLRVGYATRYDNVLPSQGAVIPTRLRVVRAETITVPAGTFATYRVSMSAGAFLHRAWYGREAPHLLVKYENRQSQAVFALRAWQAAAGAPRSGNPASAPVAPPRAGPPPLRIGLLAVIVLFQLPLMIALPLVLARFLRRRFDIGWKVFGAGALTFVASQVVHIPLNWALGFLGMPRGLGLLPLPLLAVAVGLSAGLCEEVARFVTLRWILKRARGWAAALQFGAGHGGIEAIILGVLVLLGLVNMLIFRFVPPAKLGVPPDQAGQVAAAVEAFWLAPWHQAALGGLERVFAVMCHLGMTVLVMRAVTRGRVRWLLAAILVHTVLDAGAVYAMREWGLLATEGLVALKGIALLWLTLALREPGPTAK